MKEPIRLTAEQIAEIAKALGSGIFKGDEPEFRRILTEEFGAPNEPEEAKTKNCAHDFTAKTETHFGDYSGRTIVFCQKCGKITYDTRYALKFGPWNQTIPSASDF